jgi:hypothetical protein
MDNFLTLYILPNTCVSKTIMTYHAANREKCGACVTRIQKFRTSDVVAQSVIVLKGL